MTSVIQIHAATKYALEMDSLTEDTKTFFMKCFGCTRKVYNLYVDYLYKELEKTGYTGGDDIPKIEIPNVTKFKVQFPYLKEVDALALMNARVNFEVAFKRFQKESNHKTYTKRAIRRAESSTEPLSFRGLKGMPKFHTKSAGDFSYTTNCQYPKEGSALKKATIRLEGDILYLPKLKQGVKLILHRPLPKDAVIGNVTISMDSAGTFYASIEYTYPITMDMTLRNAAMTGDTSVLDGLKVLGLDYSNPNLYVDSEGRKANYPKFYKQSEEKLAKLQRNLSRMEKGSANYNKTLAKIRKLHRKIACQRKDFLHKRSAELVRDYDVIVVEDIDLRGMGSTLKLGKNLHDNGFGMFRDMLNYKLERKGSVLVKIDRFFPSSKTCHKCHHVNPDVVLGVQSWDCPVCGTHLDRDENAAINIKDEGTHIFLEYFKKALEETAASQVRLKNLKDARMKKRHNKAA